MAATAETVREISGDHAMVSAISKAEIDQAIATAHAYPRSLKRFQSECMGMATLDEDVADGCFYAIPRDGKMVEGPTARFAEIVAATWGNCRAGARVIEEGSTFITAQGVFHDLESNTAITFEVKRSIVGKRGRYSNDMIAVTGNAACSIALRNAVLKGVPKVFWTRIYEAARKTAVGDAKTLATRRADALGYLQKLGAKKEEVLRILGVPGEEEIGLDELAQLRGICTAIKDGEITVEAAFPPEQKVAQGNTATEKLKDALKSKVAATPESPPRAEPDASEPAVTEQPPAAEAKPPAQAYTPKERIAEIHGTKTLKALDALWKEIVKSYGGAEVPLEIEAAKTEKREAFSAGL